MKILALFAILLLGNPVWSVAESAGASAESLAAAEKAFAHEALTKGTRAAFLHVLADDSIVFEPGPENGRKIWESKPESKAVLQWEPELVATSTTGDLGYTTGPWSSKESSEKTPGKFGYFVSIWHWENGNWKLIFDIGGTTPPPQGQTPHLQVSDNHAPREAAAEALSVMMARDRMYTSNPAGKLRSYAEGNVRFYRPGKLPIIGTSAAIALLPKGPGPIQFAEPKTNISEGGDLGYLWGEYTVGDTPSPGGYYLRIWRRDRAGEWKLALDLIRPR